MSKAQTKFEHPSEIVLESILKTHKEKPKKSINFLDLEKREQEFANKVAGYRRGARYLPKERCNKGHEGITQRVNGTLYCSLCDRVYGHRN
ncbi:MAG: hypothetical protein U9R08_01170 [Nanoarchaeota archaeon]|nr:hypothetical protein [Nanoarchaeota archaeon]